MAINCRAGNGSDPGRLVSIPRFCHWHDIQLNPLLPTIHTVKIQRCPSSRLPNGSPFRTPIPLPDHQCRIYHTRLLHPHMLHPHMPRKLQPHASVYSQYDASRGRRWNPMRRVRHPDRAARAGTPCAFETRYMRWNARSTATRLIFTLSFCTDAFSSPPLHRCSPCQ